MKKQLGFVPTFVLAVALTFAASDASSAQNDNRDNDRAAITKVINERTAAFNKQDAKKQAALFTEDADFYASNGVNHAKGREGIEKLLGHVATTIFQNAKLQQDISQIVFLNGNTALATVALTMKRPDSDGGTYQNRGLRVLVKSNGTWRIRTFMNQRVLATSKVDVPKRK